MPLWFMATEIQVEMAEGFAEVQVATPGMPNAVMVCTS